MESLKRERRKNAGNKMAALIESSAEEDEFYKSAYGGNFGEDDVDDVYESPASSEGEDQVDSDFDNPEVEDEPISAGEDEEGKQRRPRKSALSANPERSKVMLAKMAHRSTNAAIVDIRTHEKLMKEAKEIEESNIASLKRFEEFEFEAKKRRERNAARVAFIGPKLHTKSTPDITTAQYPEVKDHVKPKPPIAAVCAVTGRPAKYRDPLTGLPYATPFAFKVIRDKYLKFLKTSTHPDAIAFLQQTKFA